MLSTLKKYTGLITVEERDDLIYIEGINTYATENGILDIHPALKDGDSTPAKGWGVPASQGGVDVNNRSLCMARIQDNSVASSRTSRVSKI